MDEKYDFPSPIQSAQCEIAPSNVGDRLAVRKRHLEYELDQVNQALKAIADNPGPADMLNKITKSLGGRI